MPDRSVSVSAVFVLLISLVIGGCASSPKLPDNAKLLFYGPIVTMPSEGLVDRPGTFYAIEGANGKVVGVAHVAGSEGKKYGFPIRNLKVDRTYSVFFVADDVSTVPQVAQPKEEGK